MKIRLTLLFCVLAIVSCTAVPRYYVTDGLERGGSYAHAARHTYMVKTVQGTGSGWAWDAHTIATNRHVASNALPFMTVITHGERSWTVESIRYVDDLDVALLRVKGPPLSAPIKRRLPVRVGEYVSMAGHPLGNPDVVCTWGYTCGRWFWQDMLVDGAIIPGMSGGPVFDKHGMVVGMNVATTTGYGRPLGIIIRLSEIVEGVRNDTLDEVVNPPEGAPVGGGG